MSRPPLNYPLLLRDVYALPAYWTGLFRADKPPLTLHRFPTGSHRRQYVLVSDPPADSTLGYVIYNHGGGWRHGRPEQFLAAARRFHAWGYGCIMPSYRRLPRYNYDHIRADQIAALRIARDHIMTDNTAPEPNLIVAGMSAGGHLAALLALDREMARSAGWQFPVRAAICCAGILSLANMADTHVIRALAGRNEEAGRYRSANPLQFLDHPPADPPRFLILHGTRDGMAPVAQARSFFGRAVEKGFPAELVELAGGGHLAAARWLFKKDRSYEEIACFLEGLDEK